MFVECANGHDFDSIAFVNLDYAVKIYTSQLEYVQEAKTMQLLGKSNKHRVIPMTDKETKWGIFVEDIMGDERLMATIFNTNTEAVLECKKIVCAIKKDESADPQTIQNLTTTKTEQRAQRKQIFARYFNALLEFVDQLPSGAEIKVTDAFSKEEWREVRKHRIYGLLGARLSNEAEVLGITRIEGTKPQKYVKR